MAMALEEEHDVAMAAARQTTEELLLVKVTLETATFECVRLQKAHAESLDAVKSLQEQRADLASELDSTKDALLAE